MQGYACVPYMHDHASVELKESWIKSDNVQDMYFVTATFSSDGKLYFSNHANHYILAKVDDSKVAGKDLQEHSRKDAAFVFGISENLFERETEGKRNFISIYYTEYGDTTNAMTEIAQILGRSNRIKMASHGNMSYYCDEAPKLEFPFSNSIMIFEVSGERGQSGHQGVNKYCEKTRRDVTRRGITLTSLMGLSILDQLK